MWQVVYCLFLFLSAAVTAWSGTSLSLIVLGTSKHSGTTRLNKRLIVELVPDALCQLLATEPWQQIAGKVSNKTCSIHDGLWSHNVMLTICWHGYYVISPVCANDYCSSPAVCKQFLCDRRALSVSVWTEWKLYLKSSKKQDVNYFLSVDNDDW